jgi:ATP-dependent DNA helicase Q4
MREAKMSFRISANGKKDDLIRALIAAVSDLMMPKEAVETTTDDCAHTVQTKPLLLESGDTENSSDDSVIELSDTEDLCCTLMGSKRVPEMISDDLVLLSLRRSFGLQELRSGQEWAINRVLSNQRSLLVLPTGAGKSLTFLLPSLLCCPRDGITIVISPLVALMRDQMRKLPFNLPAACLSGEVTATEASRICSDMARGFLRIVFISPERFCSPSFLRLMRALKRSARAPSPGLVDDLSSQLTGPGIGLICIDEAHCLSQWSFNFRPSFLRIRRELERIQPRSVLALTATAPLHVQREIEQSLGIPRDGVFIHPPNRPNLELVAQYVDGEDQKRQIILETLRTENSVKRHQCPTIVYVWRRDEADSLSEYLHHQGVSAKGYHAGMSSSQRARIQHLFYKGLLDVVGTILCPPPSLTQISCNNCFRDGD